jgi:nitric oxide dioxygenase
MTKPLSPETIAIIKSTAPALRQHGVAITTRMYERLFVDPDIDPRQSVRQALAGRTGCP